jgi:hypothetical protein
MSRWRSAAEYAEELDRRLEELAEATRRAPAASTDAEFARARWHASGLERARELLREVLNVGPAQSGRCASESATGLRCFLARGHAGLHQARGVEWLDPPDRDRAH